ncbi:MAG: ATP-binding protein, partial [Chloroflexi bacterium]|nr:ATP-binding protein [Chloroflexota bacterium]
MKLLGSPSMDTDCFTAPVGSGGSHIGRVFIYHDVSREMDAARTKDELVSVVSHELRSPLASLVGFAELLLTRDYAEPQRRQFLTVMLEEGRRLTALINDFLDLQRMETDRQQMTFGPIGLGALLAHAAASVGQQVLQPVVVEVPETLPLVRADGDRILQVVINLLSNAYKYSPNGGEVRIAAQHDDGVVTVSVRDQGLGIPADALPRLFEKFYRVDNTDRRAIKGTGLGLAISQHIIAAHGGRIWAESEGLGCGATISFTLPVLEPGAEGGDVLVIEDD